MVKKVPVPVQPPPMQITQEMVLAVIAGAILLALITYMYSNTGGRCYLVWSEHNTGCTPPYARLPSHPRAPHAGGGRRAREPTATPHAIASPTPSALAARRPPSQASTRSGRRRT